MAIQHTKLRELASWYREFAERAVNPVIWAARIDMAEDLEAEADRIERMRTAQDRSPYLPSNAHSSADRKMAKARI
jgi:hypothetical protein